MLGHHALPSNPGDLQVASSSLVGCALSNLSTNSHCCPSSRRSRDLGAAATIFERNGYIILHQAYELEAFDCDDPEEVVTQSIPHSCSVNSLDGPHLTVEPESNPKHDYTISRRCRPLNTWPSCVQ